MATAVLMSLGGFQFKVGKTAYKSLSQKVSYRWEELKRIGGRSALHFSGTDNDTIELSGTIYPSVSKRSGLEAFEALKSEAGEGQPLVLVDALGKSHGQWVIIAIEKDESAIMKDSTPRRIDFKLSLKAYD